MRIDSSGNVGIGTTSPLSKLNIVDGSDNDVILFVQGADTTSEYVSLGVQTGKAIVRGGGSGSTNTALVFEYSNAGTETEGMRIDSSGRVLIGLNSNAANASIDDLQVGNPNAVTQHGITIGSNDEAAIAFANNGDARAGSITYTMSSDAMIFKTNGQNERMRLDNSGNVGIGTTSPSQHLVVSGTGSQYVAITSTDSGNTGVLFGDSDIDAGYVLYANSDDSLRIGTGTGERMRIDADGGLRLNTTGVNADNELLSITEAGTTHNIGGFRINNASNDKIMINMINVANSGDRKFFSFKRTGSVTEIGSINTTASATAFNTSSDYRLKENEVLISDGITRLKTLKPYRFNFKIEPDKTVDGFFAHEVSSAVPEAITGVKDADETTYYINGDTIPDGKAVGDVKEENVILPQSLDYSKFTPLLTAALQEAIAKIEVLETKVAALEAA